MSLADTTPPPEEVVHAAPIPPRWRRSLRRNVYFWIALAALGVLLLCVFVGPWLSPYGETEQNLTRHNRPPDSLHWFGNDHLGRDQLTRVLYGGRTSIIVGLVGVLISLVIGVSVGGVAGYMGGWVDRIVARLIDFFYAVPLLLVVIALRVALDQFGSGLTSIFIAFGMVFWLQMARQVRARVTELRGREFVDAAHSLGASPLRIFFRHLLPNSMGVIIITATFMIPEAIFAESFLSFLGLGVQQPHASWGTLASEGLGAMRSAPHVLLFPAAAICLTMFIFQTLGEALRKAFDPRSEE